MLAYLLTGAGYLLTVWRFCAAASSDRVGGGRVPGSEGPVVKVGVALGLVVLQSAWLFPGTLPV